MRILLMLPLGILMLLSVLSMTGLGSNLADPAQNFALYNPEYSQTTDGTYLYLYSASGDPICYWNGTAVHEGDTGYITQTIYTGQDAIWRNSTSDYALYFDINQNNKVSSGDITGGSGFGLSAYIDPDRGKNIEFSNSAGWTLILTAILAIGSIAGIKAFGSGLSEVSVEVIMKFTFYLTIWGVLTFMGYPLILEGGFYVYILYFALSFMYALGVVSTINGGTE